jgi:hypothetical protein
MIKTSVLRYAAIGMATLSMAGFAAASTVTFDTTGAESHQKVELNNSSKVKVSNHNHVGVANVNAQQAQSGRVEANENTTVGGSVGSGDASNANTASTGVAITNSGTSALAGAGSWTPVNDTVDISLTGHDSKNTVEINNKRSVEVKNYNTVEVLNLNLQSAKSGNVEANENTSVSGDVMSGAAHNTNSTTTSITVAN